MPPKTIKNAKKNPSRPPKPSLFARFLNGVERVGNRLPHPVTLFFLFALAVVLISALCAALGVSATGETIDPQTLQLTERTVHTVSLLSRDGIVYMLTSAVKNFTDFAPLGVVLVTMLGVGCAEGSGFLSAALKKMVMVTPRRLLTPSLVFLGVLSNIATDIGYVVLIPIGALIFLACGRHPLAGLAAAFAGVSGGYSANLLIGALDPLLAGISTEAAHLVNPDIAVLATDNWFFMIVSTFVIVAIGTLVTDKIVEPRLGAFGITDGRASDTHGTVPPAGSAVPGGQDDLSAALTKRQAKALKAAFATLLLLTAGLVAAAIPRTSLLRNPETGSLTTGAPLINGLIPLITLLFFIPSVVYGRIAGTYRNEKDVCGQLEKNMATMGSYIVLVFAAAQFISYFSYSNLGTILAIRGADFLQSAGVSGPVLMILFILLTALLNLVMGSASAKWTILAPVFVPMFLMLGYSPALTQVAYRIGDSCTNLISPLMSYFAMVVVFAKKYDEKAGIGTLISMMLPYSLFFLAAWSLLLVIWMLTGLPLGPGAGLFA